MSETQMYIKTVNLLSERGVPLEAIAELVHSIQGTYYPDLTVEKCLESVQMVLRKREAQNAILTGLALDKLAEDGQLPEPIGTIIRNDDWLYGVDEVLALAITNIYGTIGLTNFGYLDKLKPGIVGDLDRSKNGVCNTFLDDLVSAIAAAAAARIAHMSRTE